MTTHFETNSIGVVASYNNAARIERAATAVVMVTP
jgi:hypothetical protein